MRFMLIVKATGYSEAGVKISQEHNYAMIEYKNSLARAGALIAAEELQPSSSVIRILYPGCSPTKYLLRLQQKYLNLFAIILPKQR